MLITVFRTRVRPGLRDEYAAAVDRMSELVRTMPGYISHKSFYAEDGEPLHDCRIRERGRPAHLAHQSRTSRRPENGAAKVLYRVRVQVCTLDRESKFKLPEVAAAQT